MDIKFLIPSRKSRGKKGEGRKVNFFPINVPVDVADDLKLYRLLYSENLEETISFENMFRHWMDIVAVVEPEIQAAFENAKKSRSEEEKKFAAGLGLTTEQLEANEAAFDPADPENEPWKLRYFFEKDGEELEALPGNRSPFYAKISGRNVGMKDMLVDGWTLMNEVGVELDFDQAAKICALIKEHSKK